MEALHLKTMVCMCPRSVRRWILSESRIAEAGLALLVTGYTCTLYVISGVVWGQGGGELELLRGVTGAFRPGVLTALMGASGAGKARGAARLVATCPSNGSARLTTLPPICHV